MELVLDQPLARSSDREEQLEGAVWLGRPAPHCGIGGARVGLTSEQLLFVGARERHGHMRASESEMQQREGSEVKNSNAPLDRSMMTMTSDSGGGYRVFISLVSTFDTLLIGR